jgi:hypothetical protein
LYIYFFLIFIVFIVCQCKCIHRSSYHLCISEAGTHP